MSFSTSYRNSIAYARGSIFESIVLKKPPSRWASMKGLLLAGLSAVSFSIYNVFIQKLPGQTAAQLFLYRSISIMVAILPEIIKSGENVMGNPGARMTLLYSSIATAISQYFSIVSYVYLPLGIAAVINCSSLVTTTIGGKVFLKEPCSVVQVIVVLLTLIGVILISPLSAVLTGKSISLGKNYVLGFLFGIGALVCTSARYLYFRKLKVTHHAVIIFNNSFFSSVFAIPVMYWGDGYNPLECGGAGAIIILMAVLVYVDLISLTISFQHENAGPVNTVDAATDIILSFLFQVIIFHVYPDGFGIAGAVMVVVGVALTGIQRFNSG